MLSYPIIIFLPLLPIKYKIDDHIYINIKSKRKISFNEKKNKHYIYDEDITEKIKYLKLFNYDIQKNLQNRKFIYLE
jgi:hypothetical protein